LVENHLGLLFSLGPPAADKSVGFMVSIDFQQPAGSNILISVPLSSLARQNPTGVR